MTTISTDPADLFSQLFDMLDAGLGGRLQPAVAADWLTDETSLEVSSWIEDSIVNGNLDVDAMGDSIEQAQDPDDPDPGLRRLFAIARGLDRALAYAHPQTATYDQAGLRGIAVRYAETGRFNTDTVPGALLPRCAFGSSVPIPESLADVFTSVVRIPEEAWVRTAHHMMPSRSDFGRLDRQRGLLIACAPVLESLDEDVQCEPVERSGRLFFAIRPIPDKVRELIPLLLDSLDGSGAAIGIMPELTLDDELLEAWQEAMVAKRPERTSKLRWLFVGTGPLGGEDPPPNRGVLLDRRTGRVLLEQDKVHPFALSEQQLREWNLVSRLGSEPRAEYITRGERVTVCESVLGRVVILICEDLARIAQLGDSILAHGVSHAFTPVFSAEIEEHHWEHNHAKDYADQVGTQVVVSNSLVIPHAQGREGLLGTSLAHSPLGFELGSCSAGPDVALFRLSVEAAVAAVGAQPLAE